MGDPEESKLLDTLTEVRTEYKRKKEEREFTEKVAVLGISFLILWWLSNRQ
jgi:hypothetical protein